MVSILDKISQIQTNPRIVSLFIHASFSLSFIIIIPFDAIIFRTADRSLYGLYKLTNKETVVV